MDNPLLTLASAAASWQHRALTAEVEHHTRRAVLDWFSALIPGCTDSNVQQLARIISGDRGNGRAISYVDGSLGSARSAALLNGTASHAAEFDDIYRDGGYHPGSPTISAALALAQDLDCSEEWFLRSVIAGYEVGCRLATALQPSHYRNWHITGTVGTVGAAVASAFIKGGTESDIAHAIAIASSFAAGHQENLQGQGVTKPLHSGHAADAGVLAGLASMSGITGSLDSLHAPNGYVSATTDDGGNWDRAFEGIGTWTPIERITVKNYGCCGHIFASLDGLKHVKDQHRFGVDDVARVELHVYGHAKSICDRLEVNIARDARFSLQFCAAAQLVLGGVRLSAFAEEALRNSDIRRLMPLISVQEDESLSTLYPAKRQARVKVALNSGDILEHFQVTRKGDPDDPLTDEELYEKFGELSASLLSATAAQRLKAGIMEPGILVGDWG